MSKYGYARISTEDQNLDGQMHALRKAGCEHRVVTETASSVGDRPLLRQLVDLLGPGDCLVVTRLDRIARSVVDLYTIAEELKKKGASFIATEQSIDTSTSAGKLFFGMLAVFAEFELAVRAERQREGIERAKAKGVYKGRKPRIPRRQICELAKKGMGPSDIARELKIARSSVYRILEEREAG